MLTILEATILSQTGGPCVCNIRNAANQCDPSDTDYAACKEGVYAINDRCGLHVWAGAANLGQA